ncbi:MAG: flagellar biosynthetic protein FliQ [uncultured bacterium]|nr:MAG: flagellar biosynthetic protein FliQ [uncultured bacterium]
MNTAMILGISKDTIYTLILLSAPMLIAGALIGIFTSTLQQVTQLKDQSITFIPKIFGVLLIALFFTPFFIKTLSEYSNRIFLLVEKLGVGY